MVRKSFVNCNCSAAPHLGVCAYLVRFDLLTYREYASEVETNEVSVDSELGHIRSLTAFAYLNSYGYGFMGIYCPY